MVRGAILAGGEGRRLGGVDKTQLRVGGTTLIDRVVSALRPVVDDLMLVGYRGTAQMPPGVRVVADRTPGCGPLGGLDAALHEGEDPVLLVACDLPHLRTPFLAHLLSRAGAVDAVVPVTAAGPHPHCAVFHSRCREAVSRRLAHRQLRLRDLLDDLDVHWVSGDALLSLGGEALLTNINTPDDWAAVHPPARPDNPTTTAS